MTVAFVCKIYAAVAQPRLFSRGCFFGVPNYELVVYTRQCLLNSQEAGFHRCLDHVLAPDKVCNVKFPLNASVANSADQLISVSAATATAELLAKIRFKPGTVSQFKCFHAELRAFAPLAEDAHQHVVL